MTIDRLKHFVGLVLFAAVLGFWSGSAPAQFAFPAYQQVPNPYCQVPTFVLRQPHPAGAVATFVGPNRPAILVGSQMTSNPHVYRFVLAHECCHHMRGHARFTMMRANPMTAPYVTPQIELDADCCAATLLRRQGDISGVWAGMQSTGMSGWLPTGVNYPTGVQRMGTIKQCAGI